MRHRDRHAVARGVGGPRDRGGLHRRRGAARGARPRGGEGRCEVVRTATRAVVRTATRAVVVGGRPNRDTGSRFRRERSTAERTGRSASRRHARACVIGAAPIMRRARRGARVELPSKLDESSLRASLDTCLVTDAEVRLLLLSRRRDAEGSSPLLTTREVVVTVPRGRTPSSTTTASSGPRPTSGARAGATTRAAAATTRFARGRPRRVGDGSPLLNDNRVAPSRVRFRVRVWVRARVRVT